MDFGQPIVEIGWRMANDQLLFLALFYVGRPKGITVLYIP